LRSVEEAARAWEAPPQAKEAPRAPEPEASTIRVHFWGTRGSLPAPLGAAAVRAKMRTALIAARGRALATEAAVDEFIDRELAFSVRGTFGGNTSCVEIATGGEEYLLCDLGSGVREFGNRVMAQHGPAKKHCFNIVLSHVHWDHIMGFPFFTPAYIPGNVIRIHGCHAVLREALLRQQSDPCFPVHLGSLGATIEFIELTPGVEHQIAGFRVTPIKQFHAGDSYGYRFSGGGKTIVYSTDCEHKGSIDADYPFVGFFRDADLLIFDAMYSLADSISVKEDWGHSSNIVAVELAQMARVKRLVLFHHEPVFDDSMIEAVFGETKRFEEVSRDGHAVEVISAYDGLELAV
jgi:phosphoribosyl 1,2-cyclic phosphodiesterase